VIDGNYSSAAARRAKALAKLAANLAAAGLAGLAGRLDTAARGEEAHLAGALRQLADAAGEAAGHGQDRGPARYLPMRLQGWAEIAATAYEGRRKA
jgi:hypothetical protein